MLDPSKLYKDSDAVQAAFFGDDRKVWSQFYTSTVTNDAVPGFLYFSHDNANAAAHRAASMPNFYGSGQVHTWSNPDLVNRQTGMPSAGGLMALGLTPAAVTAGRWQPLWDEAPTIANGAVTDLGDTFPLANPVADAISGPLSTLVGAGAVDLVKSTSTNLVPGWSDHGGGGTGKVASDDFGIFNSFLEIGGPVTSPATTPASRTHNDVLVPSIADVGHLFLAFDLQVLQAAPGGTAEEFRVSMGDTVVYHETITTGEPHFRTIWVDLDSLTVGGKPVVVRGHSLPLTFAVVVATDATAAAPSAVVRVDNLRFESFNLSGLKDKIKAVGISGVTVITHDTELAGTPESGDDMRPLSEAIRAAPPPTRVTRRRPGCSTSTCPTRMARGTSTASSRSSPTTSRGWARGSRSSCNMTGPSSRTRRRPAGPRRPATGCSRCWCRSAWWIRTIRARPRRCTSSATVPRGRDERGGRAAGGL